MKGLITLTATIALLLTYSYGAVAQQAKEPQQVKATKKAAPTMAKKKVLKKNVR